MKAEASPNNRINSVENNNVINVTSHADIYMNIFYYIGTPNPNPTLLFKEFHGLPYDRLLFRMRSETAAVKAYYTVGHKFSTIGHICKYFVW